MIVPQKKKITTGINKNKTTQKTNKISNRYGCPWQRHHSQNKQKQNKNKTQKSAIDMVVHQQRHHSYNNQKTKQKQRNTKVSNRYGCSLIKTSLSKQTKDKKKKTEHKISKRYECPIVNAYTQNKQKQIQKSVIYMGVPRQRNHSQDKQKQNTKISNKSNAKKEKKKKHSELQRRIRDK